MDKKVVELYIINITNSQAQAGAFAILLGEVYGNRQLPIIIGPTEAQATLMELRKLKAPRPLTHDLFMNTLKELGVKFRYMLIYKVQEGIFYSYIYLQKDNEIFQIDARTSDAIALAVRAKSTILIYDSILEQEGLHMETKQTTQNEVINITETRKREKGRNQRESIPLSLNELLEKAIEEENYEMAAKLRDQINSQKKGNNP